MFQLHNNKYERFFIRFCQTGAVVNPRTFTAKLAGVDAVSKWEHLQLYVNIHIISHRQNIINFEYYTRLATSGTIFSTFGEYCGSVMQRHYTTLYPIAAFFLFQFIWQCCLLWAQNFTPTSAKQAERSLPINNMARCRVWKRNDNDYNDAMFGMK